MHPASETPDSLFLAFQEALAGRYSIERELGRGGMGVVYLAREVHLDRPVAIKLLPPDKASLAQLRARFLAEARVAAKLSHPNIIPIHAVEDVDGFVFFVMTYVDGETLTQRVRARGPLSSSEGARVLREVAWALAYAHEQGLVHRDVKPDNILIEASSGRVLVADFGIAGAMGRAADDGVSGTPEFMSPEQVLGAQLDARSDLYGLGATAFFAFSGRFPFEGRSATEILAKQVTEPAPLLASLGVSVPRKLVAIIDRCLAKDPADRPANAQTLAEQFGATLEQRREQPAALRAFVKRNARLNGGGTMAVSLLLVPASAAASSLFGWKAGVAFIAVSAGAFPFAYFVDAARKLSLLGFSHRDLGPAFSAEIEQAREERAVEVRTKPPGIEVHLPFAARTAAVTAAVSGGALFVAHGMMTNPVIVVFAASTALTIGLTIAAVSVEERHRDVDTAFWRSVWMGRLGRAAFGVARRLLGNKVRQSAMTHRATELSLGMAAEQLYESLPKAMRGSLRDLPETLRRLQRDAQLLRARYDDLQDAVSSLSRSDGADDLTVDRDAVHAKLGEAVGALETIRLNLLRLHAGSATVESFTTHLGLAADVCDDVERLIAAQEEVNRVIEYPRQAEPTPV